MTIPPSPPLEGYPATIPPPNRHGMDRRVEPGDDEWEWLYDKY
jgi:hypothetical protein